MSASGRNVVRPQFLLGTAINPEYDGFMLYAAVSMVVLASPIGVGKSRISISEAYRHESKTTSGGDFSSNWSETSEAERTKLTIEIEMPVSVSSINGATTFQVSVGGFSFKQRLGDDPSYAPGKSSAKLVEGTGGSVIAVSSKAELRWEKGKLFAKIIADSATAPSAVGSTFRDSQIGKIEAVVQANVKFGTDEQNFRVPVSGKVARKVAASANVSGSATTVDLRGRTEIQ